MDTNYGGAFFIWLNLLENRKLNCTKRGRPSIMKAQPKSQKKYEDMTSEEKVKYLEEKNLYLEAENESLKKLRALVLQRKAQESKKK